MRRGDHMAGPVLPVLRVQDVVAPARLPAPAHDQDRRGQEAPDGAGSGGVGHGRAVQGNVHNQLGHQGRSARARQDAKRSGDGPPRSVGNVRAVEEVPHVRGPDSVAGHVLPVLRHAAVRASVDIQAQAVGKDHGGQEEERRQQRVAERMGREQGMTAGCGSAPGRTHVQDADWDDVVPYMHAERSQPPAELYGCQRCHAASRRHVVAAETAVQAARTYSQAAACSGPADAAILYDAASGELEDAEMYYGLAATAVWACDRAARRRLAGLA